MSENPISQLDRKRRAALKIDGDLLHSSSALPIMSGGKKVNSKLVWKRAEGQS